MFQCAKMNCSQISQNVELSKAMKKNQHIFPSVPCILSTYCLKTLRLLVHIFLYCKLRLLSLLRIDLNLLLFNTARTIMVLFSVHVSTLTLPPIHPVEFLYLKQFSVSSTLKNKEIKGLFPSTTSDSWSDV